MTVTFANKGILRGTPGQPYQTYRLDITLDGSGTTGSFATGFAAAPLYYQNAQLGSFATASPSSASVTKVVATSGSEATNIDVTLSGAGTSGQVVTLFAVFYNQDSA